MDGGEVSRASVFRRRRKNAPDGPREDRIVIKTTPEENQELRAMAEQRGMSVQRMLINAVRSPGAMAAAVPLEERRAAFAELTAHKNYLAAMSNNINQIAVHANAEQFVPPNLAPALAAIVAMQRRLDEGFNLSYGRLGG